MPFTISPKPHLLDLTDRNAATPATPREQFSDIRERYRAMDEDDLSLELVELGEVIARLKAGDGTSATQASLSFHQAKAKIVHQVLWRRQREREEREDAQKQANFERQKASEEAAAIRKAERVRVANFEHNRFTKAFMAEAKRRLKPATYDRLYQAALVAIGDSDA